LLFQQWDFNIRRSLAGVSLSNCAGDHLETEKQHNEEKRAPTEMRHNRSGSLFIHFELSLYLIEVGCFTDHQELMNAREKPFPFSNVLDTRENPGRGMKLRVAAPKVFGVKFLRTQHSFPFQARILRINEEGQVQSRDV